MKIQQVIFWDIDGTLIHSDGAGVRAWLRGMRDCFELDGNIEGIRWAGRTDPFIGRLFFEKFGLADENDAFARFLDRYVEHLPGELQRNGGRVLPGVRDLLDRVADHPTMQQGLLTGNIARGAEHKLRHFGLWDYFPLGSFADGVFERNDLSPRALELARARFGAHLRGEDLTVIGDTPHDVRCGKVIGARTVAVATGHFAIDQLREEAPDLLFESLADADAVWRALGGA